MNQKGYEMIRQSVPASDISPIPKEGEDFKYLSIGTSGSENPASILNQLEQAELMSDSGRNNVPRLRFLGQSAFRDSQGTITHLVTFEDLNYSRK